MALTVNFRTLRVALEESPQRDMPGKRFRERFCMDILADWSLPPLEPNDPVSDLPLARVTGSLEEEA